MIQVAVGDQDVVQALEAQTGLHDLALGAFPAVDQEAIFIVHHHLGGKPAAGGRGRGGSAKE